MSDTVTFVVPGVPPTGNMYVRHTRGGRHYVTREALKFKADVGLCARRQYIVAKKYEVSIVVWLGRKQRLDLDNAPKLILDGMVAAGVIHSDAAVFRLHLEKGRDWTHPRTEISVRAI